MQTALRSIVAMFGLALSLVPVVNASAQTPGQWTNTPEMSTSRETFTATVLQDGRILVAGGFSAGSGDTAELFDPAKNEWSITGSMSTPRNGHGAVRLLDGRVLVAGGNGLGDPEETAEIWDPGTGEWAQTGRLPGRRIDGFT